MAVDHAAVLAALKQGESQNAVARRLGYSPSTVNHIARSNGIRSHSEKKVSPEEAETAAALADYCLERRVALLNKVFDQAEQMVPTATTPHKLQALAIAIGILIDKRRLEDGEATGRVEVSGDDARERLAARLDDLAARRRTKARPESIAG